jgi:hypothetical protein
LITIKTEILRVKLKAVNRIIMAIYRRLSGNVVLPSPINFLRDSDF